MLNLGIAWKRIVVEMTWHPSLYFLDDCVLLFYALVSLIIISRLWRMYTNHSSMAGLMRFKSRILVSTSNPQNSMIRNLRCVILFLPTVSITLMSAHFENKFSVHKCSSFRCFARCNADGNRTIFHQSEKHNLRCRKNNKSKRLLNERWITRLLALTYLLRLFCS